MKPDKRFQVCDEILRQVIAKYPELHSWDELESDDDLNDIMNDLFYDLRELISANKSLREAYIKNEWGK